MGIRPDEGAGEVEGAFGDQAAAAVWSAIPEREIESPDSTQIAVVDFRFTSSVSAHLKEYDKGANIQGGLYLAALCQDGGIPPRSASPATATRPTGAARKLSKSQRDGWTRQ